MDVMRAGARATWHGHFPIAGTLLVFCIAIDVIEVFGSYYQHDVVGHWACAMRPLGAIRAFVLLSWLAFVDNRCAEIRLSRRHQFFFYGEDCRGSAAVVGGWLALGLQRQWYIEERKAAFEGAREWCTGAFSTADASGAFGSANSGHLRWPLELRHPAGPTRRF